MYTEYIDSLIEALHSAVTTRKGAGACGSYEESIQSLLNVFLETKRNGKTLFFVGNGGSAAIASHMSADFMKNGGMKTNNIYDSAVTTCMGNDYGYEYVFSKPLERLLCTGDLLVAISGSGNSANIVNAIRVAGQKGARVITFSGFKGNNKIRQMGDINVWIPKEHFGIVESIHNMILQHIVDIILEQDGIQE